MLRHLLIVLSLAALPACVQVTHKPVQAPAAVEQKAPEPEKPGEFAQYLPPEMPRMFPMEEINKLFAAKDIGTAYFEVDENIIASKSSLMPELTPYRVLGLLYMNLKEGEGYAKVNLDDPSYFQLLKDRHYDADASPCKLARQIAAVVEKHTGSDKLPQEALDWAKATVIERCGPVQNAAETAQKK